MGAKKTTTKQVTPRAQPEDLLEVAEAIRSVAYAVLPRTSVAGTDAAGGSVISLTEAVMGVTAGLHAIAESIDGLAQAVRRDEEGTDE